MATRSGQPLICRYHVNGNCRAGATCKNFHATDRDAAKEYIESRDTRLHHLCAFHPDCIKSADECTFAHLEGCVPAIAAAAAAERAERATAQGPRPAQAAKPVQGPRPVAPVPVNPVWAAMPAVVTSPVAAPAAAAPARKKREERKYLHSPCEGMADAMRKSYEMRRLLRELSTATVKIEETKSLMIGSVAQPAVTALNAALATANSEIVELTAVITAANEQIRAVLAKYVDSPAEAAPATAAVESDDEATA